ncbi:MAG TPA: hypothetical protein VI112_08345 [Bacteroidia bacterium]
MYLFKKRSWFYVPASVAGTFIALVTLTLNTWFFLAIDRNSHSVSDTLINFFPYFVSFWTVYGWIASNTSAKNSAATQ